MMGDGMMGGMGAWMLLWVLVGIAILVLAVVGIVWLVRGSSSSSPASPASTRESPDEVLSRRYAAGEIDDEEYARRRSGLS